MIRQYKLQYQNECIPNDKCNDKTYSWTYFNKLGVLCHDKTNVYEKIQSELKNADYKSDIMRGLAPSTENAFYGDVSEYGETPEELIRWLTDQKTSAEKPLEAVTPIQPVLSAEPIKEEKK